MAHALTAEDWTAVDAVLRGNWTLCSDLELSAMTGEVLRHRGALSVSRIGQRRRELGLQRPLGGFGNPERQEAFNRYIREHWRRKSDVQMAADLGVTAPAIRQRRKRLGFERESGASGDAAASHIGTGGDAAHGKAVLACRPWGFGPRPVVEARAHG